MSKESIQKRARKLLSDLCLFPLRKGQDAEIALIAAALAPQWQPIETAPKDGTAILLTNGKDVAEGHWYFEEGGTTEHRDLDGRYIDQTDSDGYDGWLDWDGGMQPDPTHWMPLPAPPEAA